MGEEVFTVIRVFQFYYSPIQTKLFRMVYETPAYIDEPINYTKPELCFGDVVNLTALYNITGSNVVGVESSNDTYTVTNESEPYDIGGIIAGYIANLEPYYPYIILIVVIGLLLMIAGMFKKRR